MKASKVIKTKKKRSPNYSRTKGHNAERLYVKIFRDLGFDKCITSRFGSQLADSSKIDLMFIPYNVQIKAGYMKNGSLKPTVILKDMEEAINKNYPSDAKERINPSLIIHHKDSENKKRVKYDTMVYMTFEDFIKLLPNKK